MKRLIVATGNLHKLGELSEMLAPLPVLGAKAIGGMPEVEETADTFLGNALIKADALRALVEPDDGILADDSGLAVDALEGRPGVRSARYAGQPSSDVANWTKLLEELSGVGLGNRQAAFICCLVLILPHGELETFEGRCEGVIAECATGNEGFGYDPVFIPDGYTDSFGVLGPEVKARMSHRAMAVRGLQAFLADRV